MWYESHYLIEPDMGIAFALIPKCGSTSIIQAIRPEYLSSRAPELLNTPGHQVVGKLDHYDEVVASGLPVAVFVRPWQERLMSALKTLRSTDSFDTSAELLRLVEGVDAKRMDIHLRPQSWYVAGLNVAFVGRVENMAADWRRLATQLGRTLPRLPKLNEGTHPDWQTSGYDFSRLAALYADDEVLYQQAAA